MGIKIFVMSKINKKLIIFLVMFGVISFFVVPVLATDYGYKATGGAAGLKSGEITNIVGNLIGAGLSMIGVLFFALMLFGGVTWMLARGNQEMEKKAMDTITGAIIGIIIVVASYAITNFVFTGIMGETNTGNTEAKTCATEHPDWECKKITECTIPGEYEDIENKGDTWEKKLCSVSDEMCCGEVESADGEDEDGEDEDEDEDGCHATGVGLSEICTGTCFPFPGDVCGIIGNDVQNDVCELYCVPINEDECILKNPNIDNEVECWSLKDKEDCQEMQAQTGVCVWEEK